MSTPSPAELLAFLLEHGFLQPPCSLSLCVFHKVRVRIEGDPRAAVS